MFVLKTVENYAFECIPSLHTLDLSENQIIHLSKEAFFGLKYLRGLNLSCNSLYHVPADALEVLRQYASLQYLDLSSNNLAEIIIEDAFSAVSSSLKYLNLRFNNQGRIQVFEKEGHH